MKALQIVTHATEAKFIDVAVQEKSIPAIKADEALIQVEASGVNASDALAAIGYFDHATTPRIPGRDFAGRVVKGPEALVGKKVWGTGGAAGIDFDGAHAQYIVLPLSAISEMPSTLSFEQAGSVTLPYVTAYYAIAKRGQLAKNESCLIMGALGQVGRAAMLIATWLGANPIGVVRGQEDLKKAQALGFQVVDSEQSDFEKQAVSLNNNKPFDVILNTLGNIYWTQLLSVLAPMGRIATIGAPPKFRMIDVNIFEIYRANQTIIGVNTVPLDFTYNAGLLNELRDGFESGVFSAPDSGDMLTFLMEQASDAFKAVLNPEIAKRIVIQF